MDVELEIKNLGIFANLNTNSSITYLDYKIWETVD